MKLIETGEECIVASTLKILMANLITSGSDWRHFTSFWSDKSGSVILVVQEGSVGSGGGYVCLSCTIKIESEYYQFKAWSDTAGLFGGPFNWVVDSIEPNTEYRTLSNRGELIVLSLRHYLLKHARMMSVIDPVEADINVDIHY